LAASSYTVAPLYYNCFPSVTILAVLAGGSSSLGHYQIID